MFESHAGVLLTELPGRVSRRFHPGLLGYKNFSFLSSKSRAGVDGRAQTSGTRMRTITYAFLNDQMLFKCYLNYLGVKIIAMKELLYVNKSKHNFKLNLGCDLI